MVLKKASPLWSFWESYKVKTFGLKSWCIPEKHSGNGLPPRINVIWILFAALLFCLFYCLIIDNTSQVCPFGGLSFSHAYQECTFSVSRSPLRCGYPLNRSNLFSQYSHSIAQRILCSKVSPAENRLNSESKMQHSHVSTVQLYRFE